jgi:hypothetical protein
MSAKGVFQIQVLDGFAKLTRGAHSSDYAMVEVRSGGGS